MFLIKLILWVLFTSKHFLPVLEALLEFLWPPKQNNLVPLPYSSVLYNLLLPFLSSVSYNLPFINFIKNYWELKPLSWVCSGFECAASTAPRHCHGQRDQSPRQTIARFRAAWHHRVTAGSLEIKRIHLVFSISKYFIYHITCAKLRTRQSAWGQSE